MSWFPDIFWLITEWVLLLGISALVGLFIGWLVWRRPGSASQASTELSERAQARTAAAASIVGSEVGHDLDGASPSRMKQTQQASSSGKSDKVEDALVASSNAEVLDLSDMAELRAERDELESQRNSLRSQLSRIESLVGDAEMSRGLE